MEPVHVEPVCRAPRRSAHHEHRRLLVPLVAVLWAACTAERVNRPAPPPVDCQSLEIQPAPDAGTLAATEKERAVTQLYPKALASAAFAELLPLLAEDAHFSFGDKDARGQDRVVQMHDELFGAFEQRSFVTSQVFRTDRSQALEWTMTGVHGGAWKGIAATHQPVTIKGLTLLFTNDDGSISDVHVYFDEAVVKAQLGTGSMQLKKLPPPAVPSGPTQVFEQAGTRQEAANVALMRAMLQALEDNQEETYVATLAPDVEVFTLDRPKPVRGSDANARLFRMMRKSIGDLDTVVLNAWGVQQFAIVEYSIAGLQLAPLGRIAFVPNHLFNTRVVDAAEIRNGKISRIWRYDDSGSLEPDK